MERLTPWGVLLEAMGKTVEEVGKSMQKEGRPSSPVTSIDQLKEYRNTLQECASTLEWRINALEAGN